MCTITIKSFGKIAQAVDQRIEFSFGNIHFLLEDITLLYIAKMEQFERKRLFVGAFANKYYSMLGLGDVKNVMVKIPIYVSSVQKLLW